MASNSSNPSYTKTLLIHAIIVAAKNLSSKIVQARGQPGVTTASPINDQPKAQEDSPLTHTLARKNPKPMKNKLNRFSILEVIDMGVTSTRETESRDPSSSNPTLMGMNVDNTKPHDLVHSHKEEAHPKKELRVQAQKIE